MYIRDILQRSSKSILSSKIRTLLTAFAIAVGTFSLTLTLAASNGAENFIEKIISENFDPAELIVANDERIFGDGATLNQPVRYDDSFTETSTPAGARLQLRGITENDIQNIEALESVKNVRRNITVNVEYITRNNEDKFIGTLAAFNEFQQPRVLAGEINSPLRDRTLLLPEVWLSSLDFDSPESAIGESITIALRTPRDKSEAINGQEFRALIENEKSITQTFTISAVLAQPTTSQPGTELYIYVSEDEALRLDALTRNEQDDTGIYTTVFAKIINGENENVLENAQTEIEALGFTTQSVKETQEFLNQIIAVLQGIVAAFGVIAIIASVFGIINTMYISVLQRTREIGLMKALGMSSRDVGRLFRYEAAWIGLLGGSIGSLGAIMIGTLLNPWLSDQLQLGENTYLFIFETLQIFGLIIILIAISILAGWLPSKKAAKLDPITALRTE